MTLAPGTATWCHALLVLAVAALLFPDCHAQTVISDPATTTLDDNPNFEFPHKIGGMLLTEASSDNESPVRIGLLNGASLFFDTIREGFRHACEKWDLTCYVAAFVTGNSTGDRCAFRASTVERWIDELSVDGIAGLPSCSDETDDVQYINDASNREVPFVTFDNDRPESKRIAYVGTDQFELGQTMARLLKQLRPEGGHFSLVGRKEGRTEGFMTELMKDNQREDHAHWFPTEEFQHEGDGMLGYTNAMLYYQQQTNTSAIVAFTQTPMKNENWTALVDAARHKNITYLGVDAADFQLEYLNQKYVDGLVGQSQWGMGVQMVEVLLQYLAEGKVEQEVYPTELIAYNRIPLKLPELDVDQNLVGGLKWLGITFFMIISLCSLICVGWTVVNRSAIVVNAAQPFFLIMIALGILVMSAALIPLSMNDEGDPGSLNETERVAICMGVPWLAWIGFSTVFSALFAKTWRVNQLLERSTVFQRVKISEKDVLWPFALITFCNVTILIVWTVVDPLTYTRSFTSATDYWNREFESMGSCQCEKAAAYLVPLALVNAFVVFLACWQAVKARHLSIEFSESTYIGLSLFSMAQFLLTGLPVVAVVRDTPQAFYMVLSFVIFLLCMVVLLLIFLPKMSMQRQYAGLSESDQRKMINMALAANRKTASNFGQSDGSYKSSTDSVPMAQNGSSQCMPQSQEKTAACSAPLHDAPSPAGESHLHRHINTSASTSGSKTVSIREDPEESGSSNNSPTVEIQSTTHPGQSSDATLLFQDMLQMSSTTCSSEEAFETFLRLLDRSKLSASELSILDRLLRSIQEGPAA